MGLIDVTLSVIPQPDLLAEEVLIEQTRLEKNHRADRDRLFLIYTTQWWREYLQIRPEHSNRIVKLYAHVSAAVIPELSLRIDLSIPGQLCSGVS